MIQEVLERYLIETGISQKELAERLNVNPATVSSWMRGIRTPTAAAKKQIKDLTGCSTDDLLTKSQKRPSA